MIKDYIEVLMEIVAVALKWLFIGFFLAMGVGIGFKILGMTLKIILG